MKRFILLPVLAIIALVASACGGKTTAKVSAAKGSLTTPIVDILENPAKYADEIVTVKGEVSSSMGLFSASGFMLSDRTGSIAVYCPKSMAPGEGEAVKIKGTVHLVYRFKDSSFCYIKQIKNE